MREVSILAAGEGEGALSGDGDCRFHLFESPLFVFLLAFKGRGHAWSNFVNCFSAAKANGSDSLAISVFCFNLC